MKVKFLLPLFVLFGCNSSKKIEEPTSNQFPVTVEKPTTLPAKEDFYIYLMAGQSNMAGRGIVAPSDTVISVNVLTLDKNNQWVYAKEPLHYYEPGRTGLDCGLSFGKTLANRFKNKITIGIVPCAIGGSSIEQWLGDSTYRGVTLYSNFMKRAKAAMQYGTLKGMLWHQGESNAGAKSHANYQQNLTTFYQRVRSDLGVADLPIYTTFLGAYLSRVANPNRRAVDDDIVAVSQKLPNIFIVPNGDFTPKSDTIHFDSRSQRLLGKRFADAAYKHEK